MKWLIFIIVFLYLSNFLLAQLPNIIKAEYFIDTDPGYGFATEIPLMASNDVEIKFNYNASTLANGIHTMYIRAKDSNNKWTYTKSHRFYKGFEAVDQTVTNAEYFFDNDPGYGKAIPLSFNPAKDVDITINLDVSTLQNGFHQLHLRAKDAEGQWTAIKSHSFYKGIFSTGYAANIKKVEYYIDTDPGFGGGQDVHFTPGTDLDLTFDVDLTGLTMDCHEIYIRTQDENECWSLIHQHSFCITTTGFSELADSSCLIFPNPSNGNFELQMNSTGREIIMEIMNVKGEVLFSKAYYSEIINEHLSLNQPKGIYFIKTITDQQIRINKLIIE